MAPLHAASPDLGDPCLLGHPPPPVIWSECVLVGLYVLEFIRRVAMACFQNRFWTSGSAPARKHALLLSCVFWLGHFPRSKIESESIFLIKSYIFSILNFFFGAFRSIFKKVKKWISHCIFKSCAEGFRGFFSC